MRLGELEKECESLRLDRDELATNLSEATFRINQSTGAYPGLNLGLFMLNIVLWLSYNFAEEDEDIVQQTIIPGKPYLTL